MPPNAAESGSAQAIGLLGAAIRAGRYPWWYPDQAKQQNGRPALAIDYFVYSATFAPIALSATEQRQVNINGDSAFCILSAVLVESATDNTTFLAVAPLLVRLTDEGSGRNLSDNAIHASNWFGTAEQPKYWDIPKILAPNSTLTIEAQNLEAVARNARFAFHGFKIFNFKA